MQALHSQSSEKDSTLTLSPAVEVNAVALDEAKPGFTAVGRRGVGDLGMVARAQRGERRAMEHILRTHRDRVHRLAQSIVHNPMDAEEVAQDVLTAVSNKLDRFRGDSNLSTWIHRIAINTALMHKRRDRSSSSLSLDEARLGETTDQQRPLVSESWTQQPADPTLKRAGEEGGDVDPEPGVDE